MAALIIAGAANYPINVWSTIKKETAPGKNLEQEIERMKGSAGKQWNLASEAGDKLELIHFGFFFALLFFCLSFDLLGGFFRQEITIRPTDRRRYWLVHRRS